MAGRGSRRLISFITKITGLSSNLVLFLSLLYVRYPYTMRLPYHTHLISYSLLFQLLGLTRDTRVLMSTPHGLHGTHVFLCACPMCYTGHTCAYAHAPCAPCCCAFLTMPFSCMKWRYESQLMAILFHFL